MEDEDAENPHGFVYSHNLDTYKRTKRERLTEQKLTKDKDAFRDQFKKKRERKRGGKTNKEKLKNKPFMMLKAKKIEGLMGRYERNKTKIRRIKVQLGKFKKNQKEKIGAKKKRKNIH